MHHLIVVAHPNERSFTMSVAHTYAKELEQFGHSVQWYDLYRAGFDPVLTAAELAPKSQEAASPLVKQAQRDLLAAEVLTVIYPLWWLSMPAILKGYIDRVFAKGVAYETRDGVVRGLINGKGCLLITLSGAPLDALIGDGQWSGVEILQDMHIFRATGFELFEHLHIDNVQPQLAAAQAASHLERVRSCVQRHFSARQPA